MCVVVDYWDAILLLFNMLNRTTRRKYEISITVSEKNETLDELIIFLSLEFEKRAHKRNISKRGYRPYATENTKYVSCRTKTDTSIKQVLFNGI